MQVRAGKFGDGKVLITYLETTTVGHAYYGNIPKGSVPKIFVIKLPDFEFIKNDEKIDDLLMNTNEDLRTFRDGVLIWGSCNADNNLVINKLGTVKTNDENNENDENDVPTVTWKDIYNINMTGTKTINNQEVNVPTLNMKGTTENEISPNHEFIIYLTLRNDGNKEIKIETTCKLTNTVKEENSNINIVDYECIGKNASSIDLTNYKLYGIEEGNNEDSLKKSNLNELFTEIKNNFDSDSDKLKNTTSSFQESDLNNKAIFTMDENIKSIKATDFKFKFTLDGKLDQDITSEDIKLYMELAEVDTKATCTFSIGQNKAASLSCELNVEKHKNIKTFTFKATEIKTENIEISLSQINEIELINSEEEEEKEKDEEKEKEKEKKDCSSKKIIYKALGFALSLIAAILIGLALIFLI